MWRVVKIVCKKHWNPLRALILLLCPVIPFMSMKRVQFYRMWKTVLASQVARFICFGLQTRFCVSQSWDHYIVRGLGRHCHISQWMNECHTKFIPPYISVGEELCNILILVCMKWIKCGGPPIVYGMKPELQQHAALYITNAGWFPKCILVWNFVLNLIELAC